MTGARRTATLTTLIKICVGTYYIKSLLVLIVCSSHLHAFLRPPWVFSRALVCGARRGPACTPRCKLGYRAGSVARALGVKSREIWHVLTGLLSGELEPSKTMKNPHGICFAPSTAVKALYLVAATVGELSHVKLVWTTLACVWTLHMRVWCVHRPSCSLTTSSLWQPRYNIRRTASLCGPQLTVRVLT